MKKILMVAIVLACVGSMALGADLGVTPAALSFSAYQDGAYPPGQTVTVYNRTDAVIEWQVTDTLPGWLSVSPLSGSLDPNGLPNSQQQITVSVITDGLTPGWEPYSCGFSVVSGTSTHAIRVKLEIIGPMIHLSSDRVNLTTLVGSSSPEPNELVISNVGGGTLEWVLTDSSDTLTLPNWLAVTPVSGRLDAGQSQTILLTYDTDDLPIGSYTFGFRVTNLPVTTAPRYFAVNLLVTGPRLTVLENNFRFFSTEPQVSPQPQVFTIINSSVGVLNWSMDTTGQPAWLTISSTSGVLQQGQSENITISAVTTGLAEGSYTYSWTISAPDASGSPQQIDIELVLDYQTYDWSTNPGTGEAGTPYQITAPIQLKSIGSDPVLCTRNFILMADIDMAAYPGTSYAPIGSSSCPFTGGFNGNGYTIYNLTYTTVDAVSNIGLFGYAKNADIKDIRLENVDISSRGGFIGGLVGTAYYNSSIQNCSVTGAVSGSSNVGGLIGGNAGTANGCIAVCSVSGNSDVGGLIGVNSGLVSSCEATCHVDSLAGAGGLIGLNVNGGAVSDSRANGTVNGKNGVGGLIGEMNSSGKIENCSASCSVIGNAAVGGLCGEIVFTSSKGIANCSAAGSVQGSESVGGLIGYLNTAEQVTSCFAESTVSSTGHYAGGLVGRRKGTQSGSINFCGATGPVSGLDCVGGLIGYSERGEIRSCCSSGAVTGQNNVGGLVGSGTEVMTCYATGSVAGRQRVGGLMGAGGSITGSYATGQVSGTLYVGGLLGSGSATNAFWDVMTSGTTRAIGNRYPNPAGVIGLDTSAMMTLSNFTSAGWDFSDTDGDSADWVLREGKDYPRLYWERHYDWSKNPGTGEADNPYQIRTPVQLMSIGSDAVLVTKHYVLMADLDMSPYTGGDYNIIAQSRGFTGTFDGNGHVIYNLTYSTTKNENNVGMFGRISGEVRNVVLENVTMASGGNGVGGLAGFNDGGRMTNCQVSGSVQGQSGVGGLCGFACHGIIRNCRSSGSLSVSNAELAHSAFGGLCGWNYYFGIISDSHSDAHVIVPKGSDVGGLCGHNNSGVITDSYATGPVEGAEHVGGLCGRSIADSRIARCSAAGDVSGHRFAGGLCGSKHEGFLMGCSASGNVSASEYGAGGLCGSVHLSTITQSFATGHVNGEGGVGGLIGQVWNANVLRHCYAVGNASGASAIGGLAGLCVDGSNIFENCYCAGHVNGTGSYVAGFVGQGVSSVAGCFWDVNTSGMEKAFGSLSSNPPFVKGLDTPQMMILSTFTAAGWDFTEEDGNPAVWMMLREGEDYPRLAWQEVFAGDIAGLYGVDLVDLFEVANNWLETGCPTDCEDADIDDSGKVDLADLAAVSADWLR